jgi:hypothetical protein
MTEGLQPNYALQRTLSSAATCSARATNKFARASLVRRLRGAAERAR